VPRNAAVVHEPVKEGCASCHEPHGGARARLLGDTFPAGAYAAYTDTEYGLCFTCHDRELASAATTTTATAFRDGPRNLHFVHVNKEKGRSCGLCHDAHASARPALMAESVPFGQWKLPVRFAKTTSGGSCAAGCHRPYSYDREDPGHILRLPKPATEERR
jgi:predicted CXXCH cytochrome family protein